MSEKLAILFPGVGYQIDRPLLYHSAKLARERGYEVCTVSYPPLPTGLRGKPERIQQAIELCSRAAAEQLSEIAPDQHKQLLFISKSLGTAVAAVCADRFSLSPQQVYYTPVENSFAYFRREGLVFHRTADPWARTEVVKNECRQLGLPLFLVENADHSLETADTLHDLETLHRVMARTAQYLDER